MSALNLQCLQVWNPAFDVTPSSLIQGIITEQGVIEHMGGRMDVKGFLQQQGLLDLHENGVSLGRSATQDLLAGSMIP